VTADVSAQLGLEGITSIEQIVGSDPVSLAIRTGLPFKLMLRLGSQAVVRRHLKMNAGALAGIGLADAEPIARLLRELKIRYPLPPVSALDPTPAPDALWLSQTGVCADPVILNALAYINEAEATQTPPVKTPMTAQALLFAFQRIAGESYTNFLMANDGNPVCAVPRCVSEDQACKRGGPASQAAPPPCAGAAPPPDAPPAAAAAQPQPARQLEPAE